MHTKVSIQPYWTHARIKPCGYASPWRPQDTLTHGLSV
jgi:hypothetical protein